MLVILPILLTLGLAFLAVMIWWKWRALKAGESLADSTSRGMEVGEAYKRRRHRARIHPPLAGIAVSLTASELSEASAAYSNEGEEAAILILGLAVADRLSFATRAPNSGAPTALEASSASS